MKITVIGAGPAGLYFSILMKKADARHQIELFERNARGSTFGWGVVLSDETLQQMRSADEPTAREISDTLAHWDDIDVHFKGRVVRSSGHGFCGIERIRLLKILSERAQQLGIKVNYQQEVEDLERFNDSNLIVAADGIFSRIRDSHAQYFKPSIEKRLCKFVWLGTKRIFPAFTFIFKETKWGWFQAHCYRFSSDTSTFIVECPEDVWIKAGIDKMESEEGVKFCEDLFAEHLGGEKLVSNSAHLRGSAQWINFLKVNNENWFYDKLVLLGDAAATAHFSIGSGTRLGVVGAITLARELSKGDAVSTALTRYQDTHRVEVLRLQNAAKNSMEWFENVALKSQLEPEQLTYSMLTRSQRVSHENLRLRDKTYLENYERWFAKANGLVHVDKAIPPMFVPFRIRSLELKNRVVVSPMAMYSAKDGVPSDFHLVHLGSLALGGAGLVFCEMTCVSPEARITPGCAGLYTKQQLAAWQRIVNFVHENSEAKFALQLGHSGPKGSTKLAWEGMDLPLDSGNWQIMAPSAIAYSPKNQVPREMTQQDMHTVRDEFVQSTRLGEQAGFDWLELHCAHGYLLSSFISPLTNKRRDQYGGSLENRVRFPLEVFSAMRAVWPKEKPISVRISASDWVPGGTDINDAVEIARMFRNAGADLIDVSSGQVSKDQKPQYGRMYQTPFADRIRSEVGICTMAVGNIFEPDHVNSIIAAGRADLCLLARPHLADPHWTLRAAADLGFQGQVWPKQYDSAKRQLEVNLQRAKQAALDIG